jgi:hypothetical protein
MSQPSIEDKVKSLKDWIKQERKNLKDYEPEFQFEVDRNELYSEAYLHVIRKMAQLGL